MGVYNQARHNLTRFNIEAQVLMYMTADLVERVTSVTASGAEYMFSSVLSERINAELLIARGLIFSVNGTEIVVQETSGNRFFMLSTGGFESTAQVGETAAAYSVKTALTEKTEQSGSISEFVKMLGSLAEAIQQATSISARILSSCDMNEMIDATADVEATEESVCSISVTIPPGSTLIVDAVNYNVYLDGENIVYAHSGDWLDEMNRMTQNIKITGTRATNLIASILYTERYL